MLNLITFILIFIFSSKQACAYLDPGTGSYVLQILVGALIGASVGFRMCWNKIKSFCLVYVFKKKRNESNSKNNECINNCNCEEENNKE